MKRVVLDTSDGTVELTLKQAADIARSCAESVGYHDDTDEIALEHFLACNPSAELVDCD